MFTRTGGQVPSMDWLKWLHDPEWLTIAKKDLDDGYSWNDSAFEIQRNCPEFLPELERYAKEISND